MNREEKMKELNLFRKNFINRAYNEGTFNEKNFEKKLQQALQRKAAELNLRF